MAPMLLFVAINTGLVLKQSFNALSAILLLTLVAIGLYIVFGMMRVINMAHGEFYMLGAYTAWWGREHGLSFWLGLALAAVVVGALGMVVERLIVRRLYRRGDLSTLLATFGLSILLQRGIGLWLGDRPQFVPSPVAGHFTVLGNNYAYYQCLAMVIAAAAIGLALILFLRTDFGVRARATIQNPTMAAVLGINTARMNLLSFGVGSALAGFAGALAAPTVSVVPTMGLDYVVRSFLVVIAAGTGSIWAALGGGALVGGWEAGFTAAFNATYAQITVLAVVWALVLLRPRGLFVGATQ